MASVPLITHLHPKAGDLFQSHLEVRAPRMLIVEDDVDLQTVLVRVARSIEPEVMVDWATHAQQAVRLLTRYRYEAVLSDCLLDGGRSGEGLATVCASLQPQAAFALMSVLPAPPRSVQEDIARPPFLRKPFSVGDCRSFLAALLARDPSHGPEAV